MCIEFIKRLFLKVGDLIICLAHPEIDKLGIVTDTLVDDELGYPMYEVLLSNSYKKTWFSPFEIRLVVAKNNEKLNK